MTASTQSYTVQPTDSLWRISRNKNIPIAKLRAANPDIKNDIIHPGEKLSLGHVSEPYSKKIPAVAAEPPTPIRSASGTMTLAQYENGQSSEVKTLKKFIKEHEGERKEVYIAPNGKATIGLGHLLINKPKFLIDIEKLKLSPAQKNKKLREALSKSENKQALQLSLSQDLADAERTTKISGVTQIVSENLNLTDAQMQLLLNSDIKKAQNAMLKDMGKEVLAKRTTNQKLVALDLYYNIGSNLKKKAPNFVKYFKENNMGKAQAELNFFKAAGKINLGLIIRNYKRMQLLDKNKLISPETKRILLKAYNEYCTQNGKKHASDFYHLKIILEQ